MARSSSLRLLEGRQFRRDGGVVRVNQLFSYGRSRRCGRSGGERTDAARQRRRFDSDASAKSLPGYHFIARIVRETTHAGLRRFDDAFRPAAVDSRWERPIREGESGKLRKCDARAREESPKSESPEPASKGEFFRTTVPPQQRRSTTGRNVDQRFGNHVQRDTIFAG